MAAPGPGPKAGLDDIDPHGKRVLLRVDFNTPLKDDGTVRDDSRLEATLPTIRELQRRGAAVVVATHLGRPRGRVDPRLSTRPLATALERLLGSAVEWVDDCVGDEVAERVKALQPGQVLLLENLRFHPGEEANDPAFARQLARLGDIYVDDAFGAAHRAHASIEAVARLLPAVAGRLMASEITALESVLDDPRRPLMAVMGGSKLSTKLGLITSLIERVDTLCLGGAMAATFLKAADREVGRSLVEDDFLEKASALVRQAADRHVDLQLPSDALVAVSPDAKADTVRICSVEEIPSDEMILDVGPATVEGWGKLAMAARTIVWNGPLGFYERPAFRQGTKQMAVAVAASPAVSIAGGGDLQAALHGLGLEQSFSHVSTGGGATLAYLEGDQLPGISALLDAPLVAGSAPS
ncbi:MAG: phosphoglycerate kinase [Candidatus Dormiibacterota bacterium]